jgi:hypothetical protein
MNDETHSHVLFVAHSHAISYMVAYPLIHGSLNTES